MPRRFHVHSTAEHHGESIVRTGHSVKGSRGTVATRQEVREGSEGLVVTVGDYRPKGVGVVVETHAILSLVRTAEITSNAEPVVQISRDRSIPAVGVCATVKPGVLITAEDFSLGRTSHLLRESRRRKHPEQQAEPYEFTHLLCPSKLNLHFSPNAWPPGPANQRRPSARSSGIQYGKTGK